MNTNLSVSKLAKKLVDNLINNSKKLNVLVKKGPLNCTIIDAGIEIKGSEQAGKLIAEICMGGLGTVCLKKTNRNDLMGIGIFFLWIDLLVWLSITK